MTTLSCHGNSRPRTVFHGNLVLFRGNLLLSGALRRRSRGSLLPRACCRHKNAKTIVGHYTATGSLLPLARCCHDRANVGGALRRTSRVLYFRSRFNVFLHWGSFIVTNILPAGFHADADTAAETRGALSGTMDSPLPRDLYRQHMSSVTRPANLPRTLSSTTMRTPPSQTLYCHARFTAVCHLLPQEIFSGGHSILLHTL